MVYRHKGWPPLVARMVRLVPHNTGQACDTHKSNYTVHEVNLQYFCAVWAGEVSALRYRRGVEVWTHTFRLVLDFSLECPGGGTFAARAV